jgi:heme/copper-type cytochrome/quinol oxidase subunit 4
MIAYAWSLDIIGFLLSSLLAMVSLFLIFGVREYKRIALITFITLAVLYISFEKLLVAPLPVGTLIETFFD